MFEDLLRTQRLQQSRSNSKARQIIVSQIQTQNPPESRSSIELKIVVDDPYENVNVGDYKILQSLGPTPLPGIHGKDYVKPTGIDIHENR